MWIKQLHGLVSLTFRGDNSHIIPKGNINFARNSVRHCAALCLSTPQLVFGILYSNFSIHQPNCIQTTQLPVDGVHLRVSLTEWIFCPKKWDQCKLGHITFLLLVIYQIWVCHENCWSLNAIKLSTWHLHESVLRVAIVFRLEAWPLNVSIVCCVVTSSRQAIWCPDAVTILGRCGTHSKSNIALLCTLHSGKKRWYTANYT